MSRGRESKLKDFYVVQQSLPTSTPPSNPSLRISLSSIPRLQKLTIDFQGVNKRLQQRDYLSISSTKCFSYLYTHKFMRK